MNRWILNGILLLASVVAAGAGLFFGLGVRERLRPAEVRYEQTTPNARLGIGEEFPDMPLMAEDSSTQMTSELLANGGVVIFMELGCPPCSVMSTNWSETIATWENPPTVIGIASAPLESIRRYRQHLELRFPVYGDTGMVFETAYQVVDFPFRLIIDTAGIIRNETYDSQELIDSATVMALIRGDTVRALTSH